MEIKLEKPIEARCEICDARFTVPHCGERTKDKKPVPVYTVNHRCV